MHQFCKLVFLPFFLFFYSVFCFDLRCHLGAYWLEYRTILLPYVTTSLAPTATKWNISVKHYFATENKIFHSGIHYFTDDKTLRLLRKDLWHNWCVDHHKTFWHDWIGNRGRSHWLHGRHHDLHFDTKRYSRKNKCWFSFDLKLFS